MQLYANPSCIWESNSGFCHFLAVAKETMITCLCLPWSLKAWRAPCFCSPLAASETSDPASAYLRCDLLAIFLMHESTEPLLPPDSSTSQSHPQHHVRSKCLCGKGYFLLSSETNLCPSFERLLATCWQFPITSRSGGEKSSSEGRNKTCRFGCYDSKQSAR